MHYAIAIPSAIAAALLMNYAIFLQKVAVENLPEVKLRLSWDVVSAFLKNKPWILAQVVNISGFGLYALAIAFAPVSIVEPIIASGVALLAYLAIKHLGESPRRIDLFAIGLNLLGVILLGVSLLEGEEHNTAQALTHPNDFWILAGVFIAIGVLAPLVFMKGKGNKKAVALGITVGVFFGMGAVFMKLVMETIAEWPMFYVYALLMAASFIIAFVVLQAALQSGMAVVVGPVYNGLMEVIPIIIGMVAMGEKFPESKVLTVIRIISFVMILVAVVILSRRAEEEEVKMDEMRPHEGTAEAASGGPREDGEPEKDKSLT